MLGSNCKYINLNDPKVIAKFEAIRKQKAQYVKDNHITIFKEGDYSQGLQLAHNFTDPDCTKCFHFICEQDCHPEDTTLALKCKNYYPPFKAN